MSLQMLKNKSKILVIEDDWAAQKVLSDILEEEGYRLVFADTGLEGLQHCHGMPFQVVLLDLRLPDINGLEILKKITEFYPGLQVIMMSGYETEDNAVKALNQGAYAYMTKPFNIEMLKVFINQALLQHELAALKKEAEEELRQLRARRSDIFQNIPYTLIFMGNSAENH
jgi:DNA-binding NtrC family response regulator